MVFKKVEGWFDPLKEDLARLVVQLAHLDDPGVREFPDDAQEAAKKLLATVLLPDPANGFSHELDLLVARRLATELGLSEVNSNVSAPVIILLRHVKKGWQAEITSCYYYGGKRRVVRRRTGVYRCRTETMVEARRLALEARVETFAGA